MDLAPVLLMFALFALNVPIALAIAIAALSYFFTADGLPMQVYVQKLAQATDSFPLLAVPFFIFAGVIMNHAGITRRLLNFADALVGHMIGGLAQANVLLSTLMGGLSASANADAAMQAKMLGGDMVRRGQALVVLEQNVERAQVQAVARRYFGDDELTVAILRPQPLSSAAQPRRAPPGARH